MAQQSAEAIEAVIDKYSRHVNPGLAKLLQFGGFGDVEVEAEGCVVTLASGAKCLDFLGGYGVFSLGHRHPRVVEAVQKQLHRMPLSTRAYFNEPQALLSQKLAEAAPGSLQYVFYSNSGAEAVEAALKFARMATGRTGFVAAEGAYHGKTMGALSVTGREKYRKPFLPLIDDVQFVPYNQPEALRRAVTENTAALLLETVQGEGGIVPATPGYLAEARRICDAAGALLIADEVQTGLGRTGRMFGVNHDGVTPDILTLAKALGGGVMPIGATLYTPEIGLRVFGENPYIHTSTFGGSPLACAAALAALQVIEEEGLAHAAEEKGIWLKNRLQEVQERTGALRDVRGLGLMVGVEFELQDVAELAINGMARRGVIAGYTLNNPRVIRFEPPLIVSCSEIDTAVSAFAEAVEEALGMLEGVEAL